jgi:hypothetical protein
VLKRLLYEAVHKGDVPRFRSLLAAGAGDKDAMLSYVVSQDVASAEMVRLLLDRGARVNQPDKYMTPLMRAADRGHVEALKLLLAKGAEMNARTAEGTALTLAAWRGDPEAVRLLLEAGAEVDLKGRGGQTALFSAARAASLGAGLMHRLRKLARPNLQLVDLDSPAAARIASLALGRQPVSAPASRSQCCKPRCWAVNTFVSDSLRRRCTDESQGPSAVMTAVFACFGRCPLEAEFTGASSLFRYRWNFSAKCSAAS